MCSIFAVVFHSKRQEMVESEQYDLIVTSRKESESGSFFIFMKILSLVLYIIRQLKAKKDGRFTTTAPITKNTVMKL